MAKPSHLRCPFDGGELPVISEVRAGRHRALLYIYCPWCHATVAAAFEEQSDELYDVALLVYDPNTERYSPWGEQPPVPEELRQLALQHAPQ